ncbi:hypothetical protein N781_17645 [Pontibacillus halophilus JSM 076056 = DSM 19796]|uniref:Uncharacterized protein n=2 Tax=Pontibacillus TaxID=289201 RepID=A0A0A5GM84_9BACI|nr:hypothetical protein [Pontibacillus halophilus]KGX92280.1 hypothetical protein N781_17645 [Pontibacillus halophilus JSM 076056 = DSM 19796]
MGLAAKQIGVTAERGISKREFEKAWVEVMDRVQLVEDKVAKKADEVVLTMVLSHRQEIDQLQEELYKMNERLKQIKDEQKIHHRYQSTPSRKKGSFWNGFFGKRRR